MIGAIIGDITGSHFEFEAALQKGFELFTSGCSYTDDAICATAIADMMLNERDYQEDLLDRCQCYPDPTNGYGRRFYQWINSDNPQPTDSFGSGFAMRISLIGWLFDEWEDVIEEVKKGAIVSHNHLEGTKGAQCIAKAIYWLRLIRFPRLDVERRVEKFFGHGLLPMRYIKKIGSEGCFDGTCQETAPMALRCFMNANSFEETTHLVVLCNGDTDTKACIVGLAAEAYFPAPGWIIEKAISYLSDDMLIILKQFCERIQDNCGTEKGQL